MNRAMFGIAALAVAWLPRPAPADEITLVKTGAPAATIVIPAKAHARIALAATELQTYVKRICGVDLPIRRDGQRVEGTGLYIGRCKITTEADLPAEHLNPETYAVRVRDRNVLFTGRWPTPTYFAVASFIEDNLGVRWFAPGDLWEHVPRGKPGELVVEVRETVKVPDTSPRIWSGHDWFDSWKTWNLRNKTAGGEVVPRRQFQNVLHRVFPPDKYAKEHPEYYPLIDGERWIPKAGQGLWRPCESNPDVIRLTAQYARKWFDEHPDVDSFSLGMDDISHMCGCENCRAMDPRPDSYEKNDFSDRHYKFVNAVAREIGKTHPGRYIGTLIYHIARELPETVPKLEDNVFGFITEVCPLWWQEGRKDADHQLSREWAKRCKHLSRYDYYGMGTFTPRVFPHAMAEQIKFDKSLGFEGMYVEIYTFLPHTAPMIWALAKLQWDSALDVDALLGGFYEKMYGRAAPMMKQYFDLLERSWNTPRPGREGWVHRNMVAQALSVAPEDVDEGERLLREAAYATTDPKVWKRIEIHEAALRYAGYAVRAHGISRKLLSTDVTDEETAEKVVGLIDALAALATKREVFWSQAAKWDDLMGENLRGLLSKQYLTIGHVAKLESGAFIGTIRVLDWYAANAPEKRDAVARWLSRHARGSAGQVVSAYLSLRASRPANLLVNGDFEDATPSTRPARKDWSTLGAPNGWNTWGRPASREFALLGGKGRRGSAAASIAGADSACFLQTVKVRPGEKYLCICWAKAEGPGRRAGGYLGLRLQNDKGAWHPRHDLEPSVDMIESQAGWQPLALLITIPEGAGGLVVMASAMAQAEGTRVLFDDVALHKIPPE